MRLFFSVLLLSQIALVSLPAQGHFPSPGLTTDVPSTASLDPAAATRAWLETVPTEERARSDAYFEGGYWLILWEFVVGAAISILLLSSRISARLRDFSERVMPFRWLQPAIYALPYTLLVFVLSFPLNVYAHFFREHAYGLANQTFGPWFGEQLTQLAVGLVATAIAFAVLYAFFRRAPKSWWLWGTSVGIFFVILANMIYPVFIAPLFNKYTPVSDPKISEPILAMARANEIPVHQVFEVDESRQSKRVSANVSGVFGTARIALNDNLLEQCSLPEIRMVMAHEMGHYVLNHAFKLILYSSLFILGGFAFSRLLFVRAVRRWGDRWQVRGIADPAGFPLLALLLSAYFFLLTPLQNSAVRVTEREADQFGINTSREADGFAKVALKLGRYRKLNPGLLEEMIFFDHPSGRARIRMAMDWKAANLPTGDAGMAAPAQ
jgi:STE24 endopeptidase